MAFIFFKKKYWYKDLLDDMFFFQILKQQHIRSTELIYQIYDPGHEIMINL